MPQISSNFILRSKLPNFERDSFATKADMEAVKSDWMDEGHISFCREDGKYYAFRSWGAGGELQGLDRWTELLSLAIPIFNKIEDLLTENVAQTLGLGRIVYVKGEDKFYYNTYEDNLKNQEGAYLEDSTGWFRPLVFEIPQEEIKNIIDSKLAPFASDIEEIQNNIEQLQVNKANQSEVDLKLNTDLLVNRLALEDGEYDRMEYEVVSRKVLVDKFDEIDGDINQINANIDSINGDVQNITNDVLNFDNGIKTNAANIEANTKSISDLREYLDNTNSDIEYCQEEIGKLNNTVGEIEKDINSFETTTLDLENRLNNLENSIPDVVWDENSNMDDFKTPGVYNIYGERTNIYDNMPISNAAPGHSISAKLTVIASTLQPDNTEICVTQFLQLSNRLGREGASYIRTYNENNSTVNGWSSWQKQQGVIETQFNSDIFTGIVTSQTPILLHYLPMVGKTEEYGGGLNGMIDNGMYSGLYTDAVQPVYDQITGFAGYGLNMQTLSMGSSNMMETFVLIVLNDYSAAKLLGADRHISQLKYAIHAGTGECTIKKRVGIGGDRITWGDWENVGGSGVLEDVVKNISVTEITDTTATNKSFTISPLDENGNIGINAIFAGLDSGERYDGLVKASDVRQYVENKITAAITASIYDVLNTEV